MSLVDKTYFRFEANIPDDEYNDLLLYIAKYEKEILQKLLGYSLWKLVAAYDVLTSEQRIKDIVNGKEYTTASGDTIKWNGLVNTDKDSLIAYYVYYNFVRNNVITLQGLGMTQQTTENSIQASAGQNLVTAWARLKSLYGYYGQSNYEASAYNFLSKHKSDYPEWIFENLGSVNNFDL